jgi:hypothetical protein
MSCSKIFTAKAKKKGKVKCEVIAASTASSVRVVCIVSLFFSLPLIRLRG